MSWSPTQYSKFETERNRPIFDLLARIDPSGVRRAVDIGCGPGNSTELLRAHLLGAEVTGLDSSPDMIDAARGRLPDIQFEVVDIANWQDPGPWDLIFGNAVIQWLPDHAALLPKLLKKLSPSGTLAIQIPDNLDEPAHVLMRELATQSRWSTKLSSAASARAARHRPEWYYEVLSASAREVEVWRTTYYHRLEGGATGLVEWFKGTGLRPFLLPLNDSERAQFLAEYESAAADAYPVRGDGSVLLPFPRLFFVARS